METFQLRFVDHRGLHVHRDVDPHRSRPSAHGLVQRALEMVPDRRRVGDAHGVLRHRPRHRDDVHLLVAELAQRRRRGGGHRLALHLAGHDDHRQRIDVGAEHAGERVGAAGAAGDLHERGTAGESRVALRRHRARLLVVAREPAQARATADGVVQVHRAAAGDDEGVGDAVAHERAHHVVGEPDHGAPGSRRMTGLAKPPAAMASAISAPCRSDPITIGIFGHARNASGGTTGAPAMVFP